MSRATSCIGVALIAVLCLAVVPDRLRGAYIFDLPVTLGPDVNSVHAEWWPAVSPDGRELYFASNRPGGLGAVDIWMASRDAPSRPFDPPVLMPSPPNTVESWDQDPDVSADGLTLHYVSQHPDDPGDTDEIFSMHRASVSDPWTDPIRLGAGVNSSQWNDVTPNLSSDGRELYFSRNPGPASDLSLYDLWVSKRAAPSDPWGPAVELDINDPDHFDGDPSLSPDDLTMFFTSMRPGGHGGPDIWISTRASKSDPWNSPINLGPPVNTAGMDGLADLSADGRTLYFVRGLNAFDPNADLWQAFRRSPLAGDMDLNDRVDFDDIDPFVLALRSPTAYQSQFGVAASFNGDTDTDGDFDFDDINGFVDLLIQGHRTPEPGSLVLCLVAVTLCAAWRLLSGGGRA